jgi:fermentation-respiration switch protein FrsA (DUF1100 family)
MRGRVNWAPAFLLHDHFNNLATVGHFQGPVLVIHGRDDRLIPWKQGQRLASASARSTFRLYNCGHGCWDPEHLPFWRDAMPFLIEAGIFEREFKEKPELFQDRPRRELKCLPESRRPSRQWRV